MSFKIKNDWLSHKVIVQRTYNEHNGHDDADSEKEAIFHTVCQDLVKQIKEWISLSVKPDVVLLELEDTPT